MSAVSPEGQPNERPNRLKLPLVTGVGIVAMAFGYLLGIAGTTDRSPADTVTTSTASETPGQTVTTTAQPSSASEPGPRPISTEGRRLDELVPGFDGSLIIEFHGEETPDRPALVVWPRYLATPTVHEIPGLMPFSVTLNATATVVAARGPSADAQHPEGILYIGLPETLRPTSFNVLSVVWNEADPARVAWLRAIGADDRELWVGQVDDSGRLLSSEVVAVGTWDRLWCFDSLGFIVSISDTEEMALVALDTDGAELWRTSRRPASRLFRAGCVLLIESPEHNGMDVEYWLVTSSASDPQHLDWVSHSHPVGTSALSPEAQRVAFFMRDRLELWTLDGTLILDRPLDHRIRHASWSPDGRFVIAVGYRASAVDSTDGFTVLIVDTISDTEYEILFNKLPLQVFVR